MFVREALGRHCPVALLTGGSTALPSTWSHGWAQAGPGVGPDVGWTIACGEERREDLPCTGVHGQEGAAHRGPASLLLKALERLGDLCMFQDSPEKEKLQYCLLS